jgi:hypothetical protein
MLTVNEHHKEQKLFHKFQCTFLPAGTPFIRMTNIGPSVHPLSFFQAARCRKQTVHTKYAPPGKVTLESSFSLIFEV